MSVTKLSVKELPRRKSVNIIVRTYLIDALGAMIFDLFASFLIDTIFGTLDRQLQIRTFNVVTDYAKSATGAALGIVIAYALEALQLVLFSATTIGTTGNALGGLVGALVATTVAAELNKIVSREIRLDIIVVPGTIIISGVLVAQFVGPSVAQFVDWSGNLVKTVMEMRPFIMGILVLVLIGITLTPPTSGAAICIALFLGGLVGGAATAGYHAQMTGFAVVNYRENKVGGLMAQGLGTSMLQTSNIVLNPCIWTPSTLASITTDPIATMVFRLENTPTGIGMGTCGLVGPIGVYTAMGGGTRIWVGILLVCFLLPGVSIFVFGGVLCRIGWTKDGDLKLDL